MGPAKLEFIYTITVVIHDLIVIPPTTDCPASANKALAKLYSSSATILVALVLLSSLCEHQQVGKLPRNNLGFFLMRNHWPLRAATFIFVVVLVSVLAWLTMPEEKDPCADALTDIGAAVLADAPGDQDALANRAIIRKGRCKKAEED